MSLSDLRRIELQEEVEAIAAFRHGGPRRGTALRGRGHDNRRSRWDRIPPELPSQTPDLLANTSIGPVRLPPNVRAPPPAALRLARRRREEEAHRIAHEQQAEIEQQAREAHAARRADRKADELTRLTRGYEELQGNLYRAVEQYKSHCDAHTKFGKPEELFQHIRNALIVTPAEVRQYDIIGWYKNVPGFVIKAIVDVITYFHEKAKINVELIKLEKEAGSWGGEIHAHEAYAGDSKRRGGNAFGYERSGHRQEFETYISPSEDKIHVKHLVASFEVRKIRVLHAEKELRAVGNEPAHHWAKTLDYSLTRFMRSVVHHIVTIDILDLPSIDKPMTVFFQKAIIEKFRDLNTLIDLFQAILDPLKEVGKEIESARTTGEWEKPLQVLDKRSASSMAQQGKITP